VTCDTLTETQKILVLHHTRLYVNSNFSLWRTLIIMVIAMPNI
jgi:hypothetical protein